MATRYEKFFPKLMVQLLECPEPVAIDALRSACIEFCAKSLWLTYEPDPMPLVAGVNTYPLDTPVGAAPVVVADAWANGSRMTPISPEQLSTYGQDWRDRDGTPTNFLQYVPDEIVVYPVPDVRIEDGLKLQIAIRPSQDSIDVDDGVFEYWYETIVAGALARLYNHAGRPYGNPSAVPTQMAIFRDGISDAKASRQRGLTRGPMSVKMREWV